MAELQEIYVPDIGDFDAVEVIEVWVQPGQQVAVDAPLITLESDKASMDVPCPTAGTVRKMHLQVGTKVRRGDLILLLEVTTNGPETLAADKAATAEVDTPAAAAASASATAPSPSTHDDAPGLRQIYIPDIGDFDAVEVIEVWVQPGQEVAVDAPLITLESDKASMDVPCPVAGTVHAVCLQTGDKVNKGDLMLTLEAAVDEAQPVVTGSAVQASASVAVPAEPAQQVDPAVPPPSPAAPTPRVPPQTPTGAETVRSSHTARAYAGPSARRLARELGVDLGIVRGTGLKGRILKADVKAFTKAVMSDQRVLGNTGGMQLPEQPPVDYSRFGPVEARPLTRLRRLAGQNLQRNWLHIPHVTQFAEADITELEAFRSDRKEDARQHGVRLTLMSFLIKATIAALKRFPELNSSLSPDREELILKQYYHIGIAVNTDEGLVVPVIRDADQKSLYHLAGEIQDLSERARNRRLKKQELQGGCFTLSNLGGVEGTGFTPIINAPEVAILGISRGRKLPVYQESSGTFEPRLVLPVALSYDHRVIDGTAGAHFTAFLCSLLADIRKVLL